MKIKLENWAVYCPDPYQAPEIRRDCLIGHVYDDPRGREDGKSVVTSYIVAANGKEITTYSGTVYVLGKPADEYLTWTKEHDIDFDPENPITFKSYDE